MLDFSDARSLMEVIRDYYYERKRERSSTLAREYFGKGYSGVNAWSVAEFKGGQLSAGRIGWELLGSTTSADVSIDRYSLRHSGVLEMPLLYIHKSSINKRKVLLCSGRWQGQIRELAESRNIWTLTSILSRLISRPW